MEEQPFAATWSADGTRLDLSGVVEELAIDELGRQLMGGQVGVKVTVDLSAVQYLPSAAITALLRAQQAAPYPMAFVARDRSIAQRVLHISGIPHELT